MINKLNVSFNVFSSYIDILLVKFWQRVLMLIVISISVACLPLTVRGQDDEKDINQYESMIKEIGVENLAYVVLVDLKGNIILLKNDSLEAGRTNLGKVISGDAEVPQLPGIRIPGTAAGKSLLEAIGIAKFNDTVIVRCRTVGGEEICKEYRVPPR